MKWSWMIKMEKSFIPAFIADPKVEKESLSIEVTEKTVIFYMDKILKDGRHIYNKISIDKNEIKEFLDEALE